MIHVDRTDVLCRYPIIHDRKPNTKIPELLDKTKIKEQIMTNTHKEEQELLDHEDFKQGVTLLRFCRDNRIEEAFKLFKTDASLSVKLEIAPQLT